MFDELVLRIVGKKIEASTLSEAKPTKWLDWIRRDRDCPDSCEWATEAFNLDWFSLYYPDSHAWLEDYWRQHKAATRQLFANVVDYNPKFGWFPEEISCMIQDQFYDRQASYRCED
jgi:hypothetical protein